LSLTNPIWVPRVPEFHLERGGQKKKKKKLFLNFRKGVFQRGGTKQKTNKTNPKYNCLFCQGAGRPTQFLDHPPPKKKKKKSSNPPKKKTFSQRNARSPSVVVPAKFWDCTPTTTQGVVGWATGWEKGLFFTKKKWGCRNIGWTIHQTGPPEPRKKKKKNL